MKRLPFCGSLFIAVSLTLVYAESTRAQTAATFNQTSGTPSWGTAGNWSTGTVPNAVDQAVIFITPTAAETVQLNGARTIGSLSLTNDSAFAWGLSNGTAGSLVLQTNSGNASITIDGAGTATNLLSATTTLNSTVDFVVNNTAATSVTGALSVGGVLSGAGGVIKDGAGTMNFQTFAKTYTGATQINQGTMRLTVAGLMTATSAVNVATGAQLLFGSNSTTGAYSFGQNSGVVVTLNGAGTNNNGALSAEASMPATATSTLANNVALASNSSVSVTANAAGVGSLQMNGVVSDVGRLTKIGTGTLILASANTYQGGTTVSAGMLSVTNTTGSGTGTGGVAVAGGTLGGTGIINVGANTISIASGASLSPGTSATPAILSIAGSQIIPAAGNSTLNLVSGASFVLDLSANGSDRVNLVGTVDITGSSLVVNTAAGFTVANGTTYLILDNDGIDAVVGTFASGQTITASGGQQFSIAYNGGTGNDIVLTAVPEPGVCALVSVGALLAGALRLRRRK